MRGIVRSLGVVALVVALAVPSLAGAAWVRNADGRCVREWTPGSLADGPIAIVNAPLAPVRTAVGAVQWFLYDNRAPQSALSRVVLTPALGLAGLGAGFIDTLAWLGTGLVDTLTGGYFGVAPEEATHLSVSPLRPVFVSNTPPPAADPCAGS